MRTISFGLLVAAALALCLSCASPAPQVAIGPSPPAAMPPAAASPTLDIRVSLAPGHDPKAGRLIVVAAPVASVPVQGDAAPRALNPGPASFIAAQETPHITPAESVSLDADELAWPYALSRMPPGDYWVQVRLDVNRNAAFRFSDMDDDFASDPVRLQLPSSSPIMATLRPVRDIVAAPATQAAKDAPTLAFEAALDEISFESAALSEFWGRPIAMRGWVLTPPNYDATTERHPAVYRTEGFGGTLGSQRTQARRHWDLMVAGDAPPMIRVFLDHSSPWGTHEFADSVNNGPWGKALTEELIPWLEERYRMDARPSGRFVTGHSSGGWFAMWQQVRYPDVYGGAWARAPDPVDFRSFTGVDIYADGANAYRRPDGSDQYLMRNAEGVVTQTLRQYAGRENVLGDYGGQFDSFDWVFSPRGDDGRPMPLFNRITGAVDPVVARYWRDNYDIGHIIRRDWQSFKPVLDGKIRLIMGTMDTFHLDEAAKLLEADMQRLGARADFMWMEGRTHGNLDRIDNDPMGLEKKIAWEMWAVARPASTLKPKPAPAPVSPSAG